MASCAACGKLTRPDQLSSALLCPECRSSLAHLTRKCAKCGAAQSRPLFCASCKKAYCTTCSMKAAQEINAGGYVCLECYGPARFF